MSKKTLLFLSFFGVLTLFGALCAPTFAADEKDPFKSTPYPVPRFVSLGSGEVFVRTGPGRKYPVKWTLKKKTLPVEIILEYENWRKIKDYEGATGWVHSSLISGRRTGLIIMEDGAAPLRSKAKPDGRLIALLEAGSLIHLENCDGTWCRIRISGYKGYTKQQNIWGAYENEVFD